MKKKKQIHSQDAVSILKDRISKGDPKKIAKLEKDLEKERMALQVGQSIYDIRTKANLTQQELADLIGTKKSSISRLEDADYGGHSINMLLKIAVATGMKLEVNFVKSQRKKVKKNGSQINSERATV